MVALNNSSRDVAIVGRCCQDQNFARSTLQFLHFRPPFLFAIGVMGRRAKNKQGDPLPLDADPDLNGSLKRSKPKSKPGPKGRTSAQSSKARLGKRKPERDDEGDRVTKKLKGRAEARCVCLTEDMTAFSFTRN